MYSLCRPTRARSLPPNPSGAAARLCCCCNHYKSFASVDSTRHFQPSGRLLFLSSIAFAFRLQVDLNLQKQKYENARMKIVELEKSIAQHDSKYVVRRDLAATRVPPSGRARAPVLS